MTRWQVYLVLGIGIFGLGLGTGLGLASKHYDQKATAAQTAADEHHGAASAAAARAQQDRAKADQLAADLQAKARATEQAHATSQRAGSNLPPIDQLPQIPPPSMGPDLVALVQAQDKELKTTQDELAATKLQLSIKSAEADHWHQAYLEDEKAFAAQRIAEQATVRRERIKGWERVAGAAIVAYAAGRYGR